MHEIVPQFSWNAVLDDISKSELRQTTVCCSTFDPSLFLSPTKRKRFHSSQLQLNSLKIYYALQKSSQMVVGVPGWKTKRLSKLIRTHCFMQRLVNPSRVKLQLQTKPVLYLYELSTHEGLLYKSQSSLGIRAIWLVILSSMIILIQWNLDKRSTP